MEGLLDMATENYIAKKDTTNRSKLTDSVTSFTTDGTYLLLYAGINRSSKILKRHIVAIGKNPEYYDIWFYNEEPVAPTKELPYEHNTTYVYAIRKEQ